MRRREIRQVVGILREHPLVTVRQCLKQPFVVAAERRMRQLGQLEIGEIAGPTSRNVHLSPPSSRHEWSLGVLEQLVLQILIATRGVTTVFEIGTFNGGTTAVVAEALPDDGRVVTVDLPDEAFAATQSPRSFSASDVGAEHRASPAAHKVTQLRVDSLELDTAPWRNWAELVIVDGAHDYEHGYCDTRSALDIVKPGGIVLWDDFAPYWHGLVHGILDAAEDRALSRVAGLPIAILDGA